MNARLVFRASAILELSIGLAMLTAPLFVIGLLLGEGMGPIGVAVTRVLGLGLLSVGVADWEPAGHGARIAPRIGLCLYNLGAAFLLVVFGTIGGLAGILLWPSAGLHLFIGTVMVWAIVAPPRGTQTRIL